MAKVGLVTVLYNSDRVLEGFFKSLSVQTFKDYKLYIIDNSPSAETDKVISQYTASYPILEYIHIKSSGNIGVAAGNNVGIKAALKDDSDYILLLNNDIEFEQCNLIEELVKQAELRNESLIIPKILFYDSRKIWMAGGRMLYFKGATQHIGEGKDDSNIYDKEGYYNYAPTCFMLISKEVFKSVGMMDEKYFVYYDDTDFIFRAGKKNYRILYLPKLVVLHKVSSSSGGDMSTFGMYYLTRNRLYFVNKNFKKFKKLSPILYSYLAPLIRSIFYSKELRKALFRGIKDGTKLIFNTRKEEM